MRVYSCLYIYNIRVHRTTNTCLSSNIIAGTFNGKVLGEKTLQVLLKYNFVGNNFYRLQS